MGFSGAILSYAKEVVVDRKTALKLDKQIEFVEVNAWKNGMLETVELAQSNGHVAVKFSGAGQFATHLLLEGSPPSPMISQATAEICEYAEARGVRLLIDAEQNAMQAGIDAWTLNLQRRYNKSHDALIYGTYQAYLRSTPATLAQHLMVAQQENFTLGIKLVRGAYMASDPRNLFWDSKGETDRIFDGIAENLIRRRWECASKMIEQSPGQLSNPFPRISLILASHNRESMRKALSIRQVQAHTGVERIDLAYSQLMGMADNVSCELVMAGQDSRRDEPAKTEIPRVYKYVVWGTIRECLNYLIRRAEENRDALGRAKEDRCALGKELRRRLRRF
ncbi:MAG: hypothetical protein Q9183_003740 [Haloplaca sp. 2 TL-2023]